MINIYVDKRVRNKKILIRKISEIRLILILTAGTTLCEQLSNLISVLELLNKSLLCIVYVYIYILIC